MRFKWLAPRRELAGCRVKKPQRGRAGKKFTSDTPRAAATLRLHKRHGTIDRSQGPQQHCTLHTGRTAAQRMQALTRIVAVLLLQATMAMTARRVQGLKQALSSVSPDLVRAAAARIEPHASRTPILRSDQIDARAACSIHVKAEHLQITGSFSIAVH